MLQSLTPQLQRTTSYSSNEALFYSIGGWSNSQFKPLYRLSDSQDSKTFGIREELQSEYEWSASIQERYS